MKKMFVLGILLIILFLGLKVSAKSLTYPEAFSQISRKPMAVLIYADWADNFQGCIMSFRNLQNSSMGQSFNFVELDIASKETKVFNDKYKISTKLPYIMLLRNEGKVSRIIPRDCASDSSCVIPKMKAFIL